jgi:hypothetical protein
MKSLRLVLLYGGRVLALACLPSLACLSAHSATVNTHLDLSNDNDGLTTLREAIRDTPPDGTVDFDLALNGATITLDRDLGQLELARNMTIDASALFNGLTIDADDPTGGFHNNGDGIRVFNLTDPSGGVAPPHVTMIGLKLTGADPAPAGSAPEGGAIRSEATLTLRDMLIRESGAGLGAGVFLAVGAGGALARDVLMIENSVIESNAAITDGCGVFVRFASNDDGVNKDVVRIDGSSISNNVAGPFQTGRGGGLFVTGGDSGSEHGVVITSSTFDLNYADAGGALAADNSVVIDIFGGTFTSNKRAIEALGEAIVNIRGGIFDFPSDMQTLSGFHTGDTGRINVFGANFALDGVPVGSGFIPHDGVLTGVLADGAPLHVLATGRVYLLPEPAGWLLAAVAAVFVARASKGP